MLRVVVIDDQEQFAEMVRASLGREPDFESIGHATNVADGLDLIKTFEPDLVAVNVHIGSSDGIASIAQITERHPNVRLVALAAFANPSVMQRAANANARGFHPKDAGPARLLWLLRNTGHEGFTVHPEVLDQLAGGGPLRPRRARRPGLAERRVVRQTQPSEPRRAVEPTSLWDEVVKARAAVAQQRHLPPSRASSIARAKLLSALERYVKSLTNQRRPIPYGLRDELRIRRLTRHE